jgi:hypothetical protein
MPELIQFRCRLASATGLKVAPTCVEDENVPNLLKFMNPFIEDSYPGGEPLGITFDSINLPVSNEMIRGITVETYMTIDLEDYLVDTFEGPTLEFFAP